MLGRTNPQAEEIIGAARRAGVEVDLRADDVHRWLYAQDASIYAQEPVGVFFPRNTEEVQTIVGLADTLGLPLIARGAGTSLAGQCVGSGLVVDFGRYMNRILSVDPEARTVVVEPGVILDDLNRHVARHGLQFGPDTSTASRCMIGGMIGNNSCGSHSILYGNTMQHVIELGVVFSDGVFERLGPWQPDEWEAKRERNDRLGRGLSELHRIVVQGSSALEKVYPNAQIIRRNTGYPFDDVLARAPYGGRADTASLARFLCGTEGTLGLTTEATLRLVDVPKAKILICPHFSSVDEALRACVLAVTKSPAAVELIDRRILSQTEGHPEQSKNRFFIDGDPEAILVVEFYGDHANDVEAAAEELVASLQAEDLGYAYPVVRAPDDEAVWRLRKAGLGLLMGVRGDTKAVSVVEDTAVRVEDLPGYIADFRDLMAQHGVESVYHAHASVGELHLRPELNLKDPSDVVKMARIAEDVCDLVRRYGGSLSGEHGDGRVRAPLLRRFYGDQVADFHAQLKRAFDPNAILNPHKIVDPLPIDVDLRTASTVSEDLEDLVFDWSQDGGLVRAVEKCNGAGACRKRVDAGGTMCPSYMATLEERDSTRGRANVFRHLLETEGQDALADERLHSVLDRCLSCKGCTNECPATVDMARLKAESLQHHHDRHGVSMSEHFFGHYATLGAWAARMAPVANFTMRSRLISPWVKRLLGIAKERDLPAFAWPSFEQRRSKMIPADAAPNGETVWLYVDPFTRFLEPGIAFDAMSVFAHFGYRVEMLPIADDGRALLSKGFVRAAKKVAKANIATLRPLLESHPTRMIVGLEPSALLTFRDEFADLVDYADRSFAQDVASRMLLVGEFLGPKMASGELVCGPFDTAPRVVFHGHCHQKALSKVRCSHQLLAGVGFDVEVLRTGCCGMAGSFGYERRHYDLSMKVGELALFPALRPQAKETLIAAPGTSCRHQILDGTRRRAHHPISLVARRLTELE